MPAWGEYLSLFFAAFGAASLLPMQSEAVFVALLVKGSASAWGLLVVATAGNVLGSVLNWQLGRQIERFRERRWFPASPEQLARATRWYQRYGRWSLLLSWLPIVGDPLTLIAGVLRESFWHFLALVTLAKGARYLMLYAATVGYLT